MKRILAIALCVILALCCMFGCGTKEETPAEATEVATEETEAPAEEETEAPAAEETEAPAAEETEAPAAEETEAPAAEETEAPAEKPELMEVNGIVTAMCDEIPLEYFSMGGASCDYIESDAYVTIYGGTEGGEEWASMRGYDMRYIDDPTYTENDNRVLADAANQFPKIAFYYMMEEGTTFNAFGLKNTTWDTNVNCCPDSLAMEDLNLVADGQWHVCIIDMETQMPNAYALGLAGDRFDCLIFGAPVDEGEFNLAWYGCFASEEEINAWAENYTARNGI